MISQLSGRWCPHRPCPALSWIVCRGSYMPPVSRRCWCCSCSFGSSVSGVGAGGTPSYTPYATCVRPSCSLRDPSVAAACVQWWRVWSCIAMCLAVHVWVAPWSCKSFDSCWSHIFLLRYGLANPSWRFFQLRHCVGRAGEPGRRR